MAIPAAPYLTYNAPAAGAAAIAYPLDAIAGLVAANVLEGLLGALTAAQLDSVLPAALRANFAHGDLVAVKLTKLVTNIKADPLITARVAFLQQAANGGAVAAAAAAAATAQAETLRITATASAGFANLFSYAAAVAASSTTNTSFTITLQISECLSTVAPRELAYTPGVALVLGGLTDSVSAPITYLKRIFFAVMALSAMYVTDKPPTQPQIEATTASLGFSVAALAAGGGGGASSTIHDKHQVTYVPPKKRVTIPSDAGAKVDFFMRKFFNDPTSGVTTMPRIAETLLKMLDVLAPACNNFIARSADYRESGKAFTAYVTFWHAVLVYGAMPCVPLGDASQDAKINAAVTAMSAKLDRAVADATGDNVALLQAALAAPQPHHPAAAGGGGARKDTRAEDKAGTKRPFTSLTDADAAARAGGALTPFPPWTLREGFFEVVLTDQCPIHMHSAARVHSHTCATLGYKRATCHQLPPSLGGAGPENAWPQHRNKLFLDKFNCALPLQGQSGATANAQG